MVGQSHLGGGGWVVFLLAVAFSGVRIALGGPTAYVVDLQDLYRVDLSTANATLVGSTGANIEGLATSSAGQMFGTDVVGRLLSINRSTGAGTVIGSTGRDDIEALHFSGPTLLAGDYHGPFLPTTIFQINTTTAATTNIVTATSNTGGASAMVVADPNTLLLTQNQDNLGNDFQSLWAMNLSSGAMSFRGVLAMVPEDVVSGLDFSGPTLYAVRVNGGLYTMNPNDASATLIGTMLDKNNAPLAAGDITVPVPEPATLVLMMFAPAGWCLRRSRAA
jgi:hypothetical protein